MRLPVLLSRVVTGIALLRVLLVATGVRRTYGLLGAALVVTLVYHDGTISRVGPISIFPELHVMVVVPTLLAVACAVAHSTSASPVVVRNARVISLRAMSYLVVFSASAGLVWLGGWLAEATVLGAATRNLLWLTGLAVATGALCGLAYAWFPVLLAVTTTMLTPVSESDWSPFGFLFRESATTAQLAVAAVIWVGGIAVGVWDPQSRGYLRQRRPSHAPRRERDALGSVAG